MWLAVLMSLSQSHSNPKANSLQKFVSLKRCDKTCNRLIFRQVLIQFNAIPWRVLNNKCIQVVDINPKPNSDNFFSFLSKHHHLLLFVPWDRPLFCFVDRILPYIDAYTTWRMRTLCVCPSYCSNGYGT